MLSHLKRLATAALLLFTAVLAPPMHAQSTVGWLRYAIPPDPPRYHGLPHAVVLLGNGSGQVAPEEDAAADELDRGLGHMVAGTDVTLHRFDPRIDSIVLGTTDALHRARLHRSLPGWTEKALPEEGFRIVHLRRGVREWYILQGGSPRAELWAAFRFAALVAEDQQLPEDYTDAPHLPLRAVDLRGTDGLPLLEGSQPHTGLLRLMASVGINGLVVERDAADVAAAARPYGMRVWLCGRPSPAEVERLAAMPNLGGVVLPVPASADVRPLAEEANALARQLRRSGGTVVLDDALGPPLREPTNANDAGAPQPEARAAMLRGLLEPGVVLGGMAVPHGQPLAGIASPNFGLLPGVPQMANFVLDTRQYGLAYAAPAWADALQTPERGAHGDTTLAALLAEAHGGATGILTTAQARAMLQQPMLQASLYAFGRLLWSPAQPVTAITEEWSRQAWGDDARAHAVSTRTLLESTAAARNNTAPLGLPLLASSTGAPEPDQAARLLLTGQPLASSDAIGTDRTASGTGEINRYPANFAAELADPARCPARWLLLFHRLPYTHTLPDRRPLAQSLYNAHFSGAAEAENALDLWQTTAGVVDEPRFLLVRNFLAHASVHAEIWRESTTEWLQSTSGVRDALGFVGSHPGRVEPGSMQTSGFTRQQTAARERLLCNTAICSAKTNFQGAENVYRVEIGYSDTHSGAAWHLLVNGEERARWQDAPTLAKQVNEVLNGEPAGEAERFVVNGVRLKHGDTVEVRADVAETGSALLDFVEITRDPRWN